jgi:phosphoserine phosphatase
MVKAGIIPKSAIKKLDANYWKWVRRTGSYDDYLLEVIESFNEFVKGVPVKTIRELARKVVKVQSQIVYRYTRDLVEKLRKTHLLVSVSGSPEVVVSEFARAWKFDYFIGTQHAINDGYFSEGEIWVASKNKQEALKRLQELHNFTIGPGSIGVGDTESDIKTFELVDRPICFNPTSGLYKIAEKKGWEVVLERKDAIYTIKSGKITT